MPCSQLQLALASPELPGWLARSAGPARNLVQGNPIIVVGSRNSTANGGFVVTKIIDDETFIYTAKANIPLTGSILDWPIVDPSALTLSSIEMVVQVNGKVRAKIKVAADADNEKIELLALGDENVSKFITDKTIRKVIVVPGKLINIVAN